MPKTIDVTELILRDAHQSLMATRMALEDMATPEEYKKAPREVRGAGSEGWDSGQVPRTTACVVVFPVVPIMLNDPSTPMWTGVKGMGFIENNMLPIIRETLEKSTRILACHDVYPPSQGQA